MVDAGPLDLLAGAAFYGVALATLVSAFVAVSARNLFRAALGLATSLFGVAAVYLFLQAEFLAVTQLLVYVGAILTLIIFGVMLTARIADPAISRWNKQVRLAAALAIALGLGLCQAFCEVPWNWIFNLPSGVNTAVSQPVELAAIGRALVSIYVLPFELLSILLLGALVGAIVIARRD